MKLGFKHNLNSFYQPQKYFFFQNRYNSSVTWNIILNVSCQPALKKDDGHPSSLMFPFKSRFLTYSTSRFDFSSQQRAWPSATGVLNLSQMETALPCPS